jgi:hypothetical protein
MPSKKVFDHIAKAGAAYIEALRVLTPKRTLPRRRGDNSRCEDLAFTGAHRDRDWWEDPDRFRAHIKDVASAIACASATSSKPRCRGPRELGDADPAALLAVRRLVPVYERVFARKASDAKRGPTLRFLAAFFGGLQGTWCDLARTSSRPDRVEVDRRFAVRGMGEETIRTLIARSTDLARFGYNWDETVTLFPEASFRPVRVPTDGAPSA